MKKLFVFLTFLFGSACADTRPVPTNVFFDVKLENLVLNQVLNNTKKYISSESFQAPDNEIGEARAVGMALINKELELFKDIIIGFNKGYLLFVEREFLTLCGHFKKFEAIEPRHIRAFKTKLDKFDKFMQKYRAERKSFMSPEDAALCAKICEFNMILSSLLMKYEYFGINWADRILDWTVFRPYELACAHPVITMIIISLIVILISYYIYIKYYVQDDRVRCPYEMPPAGVVVQEESLEAQVEARCGKHALRNAYGLAGTGAKPEQNIVGVGDDAEWNAVVAERNKVTLPNTIAQLDKQIAIIEAKKLTVLATKDPDKSVLCTIKSCETELSRLKTSKLKLTARLNLAKTGSATYPLLNDMSSDEICFILEHENAKNHGIKVFNASITELEQHWAPLQDFKVKIACDEVSGYLKSESFMSNVLADESITWPEYLTCDSAIRDQCIKPVFVLAKQKLVGDKRPIDAINEVLTDLKTKGTDVCDKSFIHKVLIDGLSDDNPVKVAKSGDSQLAEALPNMFKEWRDKHEVRFVGHTGTSATNASGYHFIMYRVTLEHIFFRDSQGWGGYNVHPLTRLIYSLFHPGKK